jgi:hypothetical protein
MSSTPSTRRFPAESNLTSSDLTPEPVPADYTRIRVALVGCGKTKRTHRAPARDLYTGSLFRAARRYAEAAVAARHIEAWFILSARHGLVHPDMVLDPYEATMGGKTVDQLDVWTRRTEGALRLDWGYGAFSQAGGCVHVVFLAGETYVAPLVGHWWGPHPMTWTYSVPLTGLGMGERIGWFTRQAEAAEGSRAA